MPEQNEQPKSEHNEVEFPPNKVVYYEGRAQEILDGGSREFHEFIKGHEELEKEGDKLICLGEGTGYNIILTEQDMPLISKKDLIFYNNYIGRPHHFGLLLANMEARGIITPDIIRFGKKATKVLYGGWDLDPNDEFKEVVTHKDGNIEYSKEVERTVETVAIFSPKSKEQVVDIADFLLKRTDADYSENCIDGSWLVPDIRATISLAKVLILPGMSDFRQVIANVHEANGAKLIILRQETKFDRNNLIGNPKEKLWKSKETTQNEKLARYIASQDFNVLP